ncbi:hypothetical protein MMC34_007752 [Xylographa carneopallida]|nr:hypothetical protein [Xylographa carneopallida]
MVTESLEVTSSPHDYPPSGSMHGTQLRTLHVEPPLEDPTSEAPPNAFSAEGPAPLTRRVKIKLMSAGFSFFFAGTNDGSLGPLVPYMLSTYNISTTFIAVIYAASFAGWLVCAVTNSHLLRYLDTGAILVLGAGLQLLAHVLRPWGPPFPLFALSFFIASLGIAFQDSHSNTFVSTVKSAHRWLGFIHAMYALGLLISPFVATAVASSTPNWRLFYLCLMGLGIVNIMFVAVAFRDTLRVLPQQTEESGSVARIGRNKAAMSSIIETSKLPGVWLLSMFFFFYLGVGITAGGWVVEYFVTIRNAPLPSTGYVPAGLYGGMFLGRLLLAEPTHRWGERRMLMLYIAIVFALQLVFWLVPDIISGAVVLSFMGFFFGPFFTTGVSIGSKMFPKKIQPTALGLVFVLAQAGGSLFPSLTGLIAGRVGVQVLQPILVGLIVAMGISWILIPKVPDCNE